MKKTHKFFDKLKSWLVTFAIAGVFGLAALGVNASKTYTKTSAYQYDENGYIFFGSNPLDIDIFCGFLAENYGSDSGHSLEEEVNYNSLLQVCDKYDGVVVYSTYFNMVDVGGYDTFTFYDNIGRPLIVFNCTYSEENQNSINFEADATYTAFTTYGTAYQSLRNYVLSYNAPQSEGNFLSALTNFMQILGGAIVDLAQPIANGVTEFARDLFIDNNSLSIVGGVIGIFAGIALAVGITTKVYSWVTSLGN